jgi:hypothetical protein
VSSGPLNLNRDQLAKALGGNFPVIRAFEQLVLDRNATPATIEEATATANSALAVAASALDLLAEVSASLEAISKAPAQAPETSEDTYIPAVATPVLGSIAEQDADSVAIAGGTIEGTSVGASSASTGRFTTLLAVQGFGCNGASAQTSYALGSAATDLSTVIALANAMRTALINNGIGS